MVRSLLYRNLFAIDDVDTTALDLLNLAAGEVVDIAFSAQSIDAADAGSNSLVDGLLVSAEPYGVNDRVLESELQHWSSVSALLSTFECYSVLNNAGTTVDDDF